MKFKFLSLAQEPPRTVPMNKPSLTSDKSPNASHPAAGLPHSPAQALCFSGLQSLCLKHALPPSVPANDITSAPPCPVQVVFLSRGLCLVLPQLPNSKPPFCTWLPARLSKAHLSSSTEHAAPCVWSVWCVSYLSLFHVQLSEGRESTACHFYMLQSLLYQTGSRVNNRGCGNKYRAGKRECWWCVSVEISEISEKVSCPPRH